MDTCTDPVNGQAKKDGSSSDLQPPPVFPVDFACGKQTGKVANDDYMTVGCCNGCNFADWSPSFNSVVTLNNC